MRKEEITTVKISGIFSTNIINPFISMEDKGVINLFFKQLVLDNLCLDKELDLIISSSKNAIFANAEIGFYGKKDAIKIDFLIDTEILRNDLLLEEEEVSLFIKEVSSKIENLYIHDDSIKLNLLEDTFTAKVSSIDFSVKETTLETLISIFS